MCLHAWSCRQLTTGQCFWKMEWLLFGSNDEWLCSDATLIGTGKMSQIVFWKTKEGTTSVASKRPSSQLHKCMPLPGSSVALLWQNCSLISIAALRRAQVPWSKGNYGGHESANLLYKKCRRIICVYIFWCSLTVLCAGMKLKLCCQSNRKRMHNFVY